MSVNTGLRVFAELAISWRKIADEIEAEDTNPATGVPSAEFKRIGPNMLRSCARNVEVVLKQVAVSR